MSKIIFTAAGRASHHHPVRRAITRPLDLSPKLRQPVKSQNSANGELTHGVVTKEVKLAAVQQLEAGSSVAEVARAFEVNPNLLHRWRKEYRHGPRNAFPGAGKRRWDETKIAQLERKVGQQAVEIDFLKGCLQRLEEQRMLQALTGRPRSTATSKTRSKTKSKKAAR